VGRVQLRWTGGAAYSLAVLLEMGSGLCVKCHQNRTKLELVALCGGQIQFCSVLVRVGRIELPSRVWKTRILTAVLYPHLVTAMAPRAGFEPATLGLEVLCSIQLSYQGRFRPTLVIATHRL
jgi:hypothetical protein